MEESREPERTVHSDLNQSVRGGPSTAMEKALRAAIAAVELENSAKTAAQKQ
jgi:hypothetical protein